jgi:hypothetical protein
MAREEAPLWISQQLIRLDQDLSAVARAATRPVEFERLSADLQRRIAIIEDRVAQVESHAAEPLSRQRWRWFVTLAIAALAVAEIANVALM